jgi:hypothetical protein
MPHANREDRNATQREYRARIKLSKSKQVEAKSDRVGKTPFASFCRIPAARIEALEDDVYQVNIIMGPLSFRYRKYDSNSGQLFMFKKGDDTSVLAGAWYASMLRPMIVGAIEEKFDVELPHFDAETEDDDDAAFCQAILDDHIARQVQISPLEFVPLAVAGGVPRDVARRWLEEKFNTCWDWPDDTQARKL